MTTNDPQVWLLLGWYAARHQHGTLDGQPTDSAAGCWGCQQLEHLAAAQRPAINPPWGTYPHPSQPGIRGAVFTSDQVG